MRTDRRIVGPSARLELCRGIRDDDPALREADWVEGKGTLDLGAAEGRFELARQILGSANRLPSRASRYVEGHGYVVVGVERGACAGATRLDPAELEDLLWSWIGSGDRGPRWDAHYVDVEGKPVLVIEVSPPRWGDPVYPLRKEINVPEKKLAVQEGTVFVRTNGRTHRATAAEIDELNERVARRASRLSLKVGWWRTPEIRPIEVSGDLVARWLVDERQTLLKPLPDPMKLIQVAYQFTVPIGEDRSVPDYRREVDAYLDAARARLPHKLRAHAVAHRIGEAGTLVMNPTDENLTDVEVVLRIRGRVGAYFFSHQAKAEARMPARPQMWGTRPPSPYASLLSPLWAFGSGLRMEYKEPSYRSITDEEGTALVLGGMDLRPRAEFPYRKFFLIVEAPAPSQLRVQWEATAKNLSGVAEGDLVLPVGAPIPLAEIFPEPPERPED